jgi:hypothetical protein
LKNAVLGDTFFCLMAKKISPKGISHKSGTWQENTLLLGRRAVAVALDDGERNIGA